MLIETLSLSRMKERKKRMHERRTLRFRCARQFKIYTFRCGPFVSLCCCTKISVGCLKLLTPADRRLEVMRRNFKWKILKTNKLLKHGFVFHFISISLTIFIFLFFLSSVWFRWNRTFLQPSLSYYGLSSFYRFQTSSSLLQWVVSLGACVHCTPFVCSTIHMHVCIKMLCSACIFLVG